MKIGLASPRTTTILAGWSRISGVPLGAEVRVAWRVGVPAA